ncbi:helix-hairpin-helix domain-containing protein [uncultured Clostridium sp.]|uniref:helix-hairpin-helix domain-containing protein n=1 Tax=uncultured Clostridium sp. TaxID=59620 RepID=UPI0026F38D21|nr:helix-hairpin-helix domain-containing protein [uncultured Clostridium sp.]
MENLKKKKTIGIIIILVIIASITLLTYGRNKKNVFKDEYMNNIFIDEEGIDSEEEINIDYSKKDEDNNIETNTKESKTNETLETSSTNLIVVEIKGEVMNPDVYTLNEGSIIKDLIDAAGGLTQEADISKINRAKEIKNHDLIVIKNIHDITVQGEEEVQHEEDSETTKESSDGKISINNSDLNELKEIPGIGEVKANAIISYREEHKGFKSIEEIKNVDGIGEKTFEKLKDSIKL